MWTQIMAVVRGLGSTAERPGFAGKFLSRVTWQRVAGLVLFVVLMLAFLPAAPEPVYVGLDPSWMWGLSMAHARGLAFGKEVGFTYGPLAYLFVPAFPDAPVTQVWLYLIGSHLIWAFGLSRILTASRPLLTRLALVALDLAAMATVQVIHIETTLSGVESDRLEITALTLAISALLRIEFDPWPELFVLAFLAGVAMLIKVNIGVLTLGFLVLLIATVLWKLGRAARTVLMRVGAAAGVFVLTFTLLFRLSTGS